MDAMQNPSPVAPLQRPKALEPAGFWIRIVSSSIDGFIVGIVNWPISWGIRLAMGVSLTATPKTMGFAFFVPQILGFISSLILASAYYSYFYTRKGWSPGKKVMGLRVINPENGMRLSVGQSIGRELGKLLSMLIFFIGFIMAGARKDKRALHDLMAGSQVVRERK